MSSDISIEKQENNISFRFDYTSCWSCVQKHCTRIWCVLGGVWGVPWLTVWLLTVLSPCIGICMHRVFCQLDEALHCTTACSWFTPLFLTTFEAKLNGMFDWFAGGLFGVQYIKSLKECIFVYSLPSLLLLGFIFSSFGSQTRDQSDHLALAFVLVYELTFFLCVKIVST